MNELTVVKMTFRPFQHTGAKSAVNKDISHITGLLYCNSCKVHGERVHFKCAFISTIFNIASVSFVKPSLLRNALCGQSTNFIWDSGQGLSYASELSLCCICAILLRLWRWERCPFFGWPSCNLVLAIWTLSKCTPPKDYFFVLVISYKFKSAYYANLGIGVSSMQDHRDVVAVHILLPDTSKALTSSTSRRSAKHFGPISIPESSLVPPFSVCVVQLWAQCTSFKGIGMSHLKILTCFVMVSLLISRILCWF